MLVNCWESTRCGRGPGGDRTHELGVCPATTESDLVGTNGGDQAGRACWMLAGTFCGSQVSGTGAEKRLSCMSCDFFKQVRAEQGAVFQLMPLA